jgi:hypothetical protein
MDKSVLERIEDPKVTNHYNITSTSQQYPPPQHGGRIPTFNDTSVPRLPFMLSTPYKDGKPIDGHTPFDDLIGRQYAPTLVSKLFFSQDNIETLQQKIHEQVWLMSNKKYNIDRQNDDQIKIIMRSYYLMFGQNNDNHVAEELESLNRRVVGYASAKIYSEVEFYQFYRKDIEDFAPPIAGPINTQVYGTRTGELKSFF